MTETIARIKFLSRKSACFFFKLFRHFPVFEEFALFFDDRSVSLAAYDQTKVSMIYMKLTYPLAEVQIFKKIERIDLDLSALKRFLGIARFWDTLLEIKQNEGVYAIHLCFSKNEQTIEYNVGVAKTDVDILESHLKQITESWDESQELYSFDIDTKRFYDTMRFADLVDATGFDFKVIKNTLELFAKSKRKIRDIAFKSTMKIDLVKRPKKEFISSYSLEYLKSITNSIPDMKINISYSYDKPLILKACLGTIKYFLAPRIDDDWDDYSGDEL